MIVPALVGAGVAPTGEAEGTSVGKMMPWLLARIAWGLLLLLAVLWSPRWLRPLAKRREARSAKWSSPPWVAPTGEPEGTSVGKMIAPAVVVGADWVGTATSVRNVVGPAVAPTTGEAEGSSVEKTVGPANERWRGLGGDCYFCGQCCGRRGGSDHWRSGGTAKWSDLQWLLAWIGWGLLLLWAVLWAPRWLRPLAKRRDGKMVGPAVVVGVDSVGTATSVSNVLGPTVAPSTTGEAEGNSFVGKMADPSEVGAGVVGFGKRQLLPLAMSWAPR
jgi:hypothetical protein